MKIHNLSRDSIRGRFRYNLKTLRDFEKDESVREQKYRTTMILLTPKIRTCIHRCRNLQHGQGHDFKNGWQRN